MVPVMRFKQVLTAEGDSADVQAVARFSDGTQHLLSADQMRVNTTSTNLRVRERVGSAAWGVEVTVGAERECGPIVDVAWRVCNATVAVGHGEVVVSPPDAISMSLTISASSLTAPKDSAGLAPISLPHRTLLSVTVGYGDGTQRDFTSDKRVSFALSNVTVGCAQLEQQPPAVVVLEEASCTTVCVVGSVGALGLQASACVPLVRFARLELTLLPYPLYPGFTGSLSRWRSKGGDESTR